RVTDPTARNSLLAVLACGVLGSAVFFACDVAPKAVRRVRLVRELAELSVSARRLLLHGAGGAVIGVLALVMHALTAAMVFSFADSLGLPLTFLDCLLLMPPI